jgi:hypothetical protein
MAASTMQAASQYEICCNCEEMLRQQSPHVHQAAKSASYQFMRPAANVRTTGKLD